MMEEEQGLLSSVPLDKEYDNDNTEQYP